MIRHAAVELVVKDHRALVGKAEEIAEVHMRAAGTAVDEDHGRRARSDHAVDPHPHHPAFNLHAVLGRGHRPVGGGISGEGGGLRLNCGGQQGQCGGESGQSHGCSLSAERPRHAFASPKIAIEAQKNSSTRLAQLVW